MSPGSGQWGVSAGVPTRSRPHTKCPCSPLSSASRVTCCDREDRSDGGGPVGPASDFVSERATHFSGLPSEIKLGVCYCSPAWPHLTPPGCPTDTFSLKLVSSEEEHGHPCSPQVPQSLFGGPSFLSCTIPGSGDILPLHCCP